jgi:hypothetical protein
MPRRARKSKRRDSGGVGPFLLRMGGVFPGDPEPTRAQWEYAWRRYRDQLIAEYRERRPGERPPPFWWFEASDAPSGGTAGTPKTLDAGLRWLLDHGQVNRAEGDAILARKELGDRPAERAKCIEMVRAARLARKGRP